MPALRSVSLINLKMAAFRETNPREKVDSIRLTFVRIERNLILSSLNPYEFQ